MTIRSEVEAGVTTRRPLPTYLQIEPVGQCNLRCQMCPIQFRRDGPPSGPPAFMDFGLFLRLMEQFTDLEHLHLQGLGEPMMHPRFFDMVEFAKARGIRVTTNTNLTLLNSARAERCVASGIDCVHVSIDGATAETYERIRVRARFARVLSNVELLVSARTGARTSLPELKMVVVLMRQNLSELSDLVRLAHKKGFSSVFVQHLCHDFGESTLPAAYLPMRDFVDAESLVGRDADDVHREFARARRCADELGIELRLPSHERLLHSPGTPGPERCNWPWTGAYVSYQGLAMPCCMVATPDRVQLGDFRESDAADVWNGREYESFRNQLASDKPSELCRSCSIYAGTF